MLMQVVALQDINKRLQEYNTSLQTYNSKLQTDAAAVTENLCRIQKEKTTMVETLSSLRGQNTALQEQLNQSKVDRFDRHVHYAQKFIVLLHIHSLDFLFLGFSP